MKTILIANPKGGSGKTTLSVNIAGYLANQGHRVAMLDLDRQKSATAWVAARPDNLPEIASLDSTKGEDYFTDHLVIDTPAGLHGKDLARTLKLAHKIIIPIAPSMFDQNASRDFLKILIEEKEVRQGKCQIGIVGMRMNARTRAATIRARNSHAGNPNTVTESNSIQFTFTYTYPITCSVNIFDIV